MISEVLKKFSVRHHDNNGITICPVLNSQQGTDLANSLLEALVDKKTVLYLAGGSTPKALYKKIAQEEQLTPGAVGVIDERYGEKYHEKSNEKMFQQTGILRYFQMRDCTFYPILVNEDRVTTADLYDQKVRELNATYQYSVAVLGIGDDGHTSSLAPNRRDFTNPMFSPDQKHLLVSEFNDPKSFYGERVGMTFAGLALIDVLLLLVFGESKAKALDLVFSDGPEELIPSRFYKRPEIAKKTLLITDQNV